MPAPPTTAMIRTEALTKTYRGGIPAVDGLDLSVNQGEIFGLLGPNGAGKTTTIGMLTTRVIPSGGRALVGGIDAVGDPASVKQLIGVVQDVNTLDRSLTVWENLYFHGRYFGMGAKSAKARADEMLETFRLADRAKAEIFTLSRGMTQRLMVARGVFHRPAVLFLDEPTASLDPQSRLALWDLLRQLHAAGQTILLTTHYMEDAFQLCDRVAIMDHGRILALDTTERLKRLVDGGAAVTVKAQGDLVVLAGKLQAIPGASDARPVGGRVRFYLDAPEVNLPEVLAVADKNGFKLTELSVSEPTLETVFIDLTGKDLRE